MDLAKKFKNCTIPSTEDSYFLRTNTPPLKMFPALVMPELKAIYYLVPKCASSEIVKFFKEGRKPLFRWINNNDGIKNLEKPSKLVMDLGENNITKNIKRNFFAFTFVCNPIHRLVSAYGTITNRAIGDGMVISNHNSNPKIYIPQFTVIPRKSEPSRFHQFVHDMVRHNLTGFERNSYYNESFTYNNMKSTPFSNIDKSKKERFRKIMPLYKELSNGCKKSDPSSVFEVENGMMHAWSHARSQTYLLNMTDSDGSQRRLDFIGRVENFSQDFIELIKLLNISNAQLTPYQKNILYPKNNRHVNIKEGFRTPELSIERLKILENLKHNNTLRQIIRNMYNSDFKCLYY